jgi:transposase
MFRTEQDRLARLRAAEARGQVELFYFDAAGFNLIPCVPYAWQPPGVTYELPSGGRQRLNVLGLLNRANEAYFYPHTGRIGSAEVIAALDHFADVRPHHLTLVILDNAPIHHSEAIAHCFERWLAKGVGVHFLPPYCPELNRIEILWRKIKYDWLPFSAYTSFATLKAALQEIFHNVGSKYQITFG